MPMPMPAPSPMSPARNPSPPPAPGVCAIASSGLASTIAAAMTSHLPNRAIIYVSSLVCSRPSARSMALFSSPLSSSTPRTGPRMVANFTLTCDYELCGRVKGRAHLIVRMARHPDVRDRQDHEDQRLHDADDRAQRVESQRNDQLGKSREQPEHLMVGEHVGEKTDAQRERPEQVVGDLDYH